MKKIISLLVVLLVWCSVALAETPNKTGLRLILNPECAGEEFIIGITGLGGAIVMDLGDGTRVTSGSVEHVYKKPGTYTVTAYVDWIGFIDADGDGEKEYFTPDGKPEEVVTMTVTVKDCGDQDLEDKATTPPEDFGMRLDCPKEAVVGQTVECYLHDDPKYALALYWEFSPKVKVGTRVVSQLAHNRRVIFTPLTEGTQVVKVLGRWYSDSSKAAVTSATIKVKPAPKTVKPTKPTKPTRPTVPDEPYYIPGRIVATVNPGCAGGEYFFTCVDCYDGEITWEFGDGSTARGRQVAHVFTKPGTYTVTAKLDWKGYIALPNSGTKAWYDVDGEIDEVKTFKVTIKDYCSDDIDEQAPGQDNTLPLELKCPQVVTAGQYFACTAEWPEEYKVATFWTFSPSVERTIEGKKVYVQQINHVKTVRAIAPENVTQIAVALRAFDMIYGNKAFASATIKVVRVTEDTCVADGGVWRDGRCLSPEEVQCQKEGGLWDGEACLTCDPDHVHLCQTEEACAEVGAKWLDGRCVPDNPACLYYDPELGCIEDEALARRIECERIGGRFNLITGCVLEEKAEVEAKAEEATEGGSELNLKVDLVNKPGRCYYVAAYVPETDTYYFLTGNNEITLEPKPVLCTPGRVQVPLLEVVLHEKLGWHVQILHGFFNQETGQFEKIEKVADLEI